MSEPQEPIARISTPTAEELAQLFPHLQHNPQIHPLAYVAPGARIMGDVAIGAESSVWMNCVLRGDVNFIRVGSRTNIQDLSMVHVAYRKSPTIVGDGVTVGHSVVLHACTIGNFCLVGMGSVVLDEAELGEFVILGAGSLVTQRTKIPPYTKAFGRPAKPVAELTPEEVDGLKLSADHYVRLMHAHQQKLSLPLSTP